MKGLTHHLIQFFSSGQPSTSSQSQTSLPSRFSGAPAPTTSPAQPATSTEPNHILIHHRTIRDRMKTLKTEGKTPGLLINVDFQTQRIRVRVRFDEDESDKTLWFSQRTLNDSTVPLIVDRTLLLLGLRSKEKNDEGSSTTTYIVLWARVIEYVNITSLDVLSVMRLALQLKYYDLIDKLCLSWKPFWEAIVRSDQLDDEALFFVLKLVFPPVVCEDRRTLQRLKGLIGSFCSSQSRFLSRLGQVDANYLSPDELESVKKLISSISQQFRSINPVRHLLRRYYSSDPGGLLDLIDGGGEGLPKDLTMTSLCDLKFRELPLIPLTSELQGLLSTTDRRSDDPLTNQLIRLESHLQPNRVIGSWASAEEFLDAHFRLLREECFASIRDRIALLRVTALKDQQRVYRNVRLISYAVSEGTIILQIKFRSHNSRSNLIFGNLLCIDVDASFSSPIWATVAGSVRDTAQHKEERVIEIAVVGLGNNDAISEEFSESSISGTLIQALQRLMSCSSGVMVESPTYYHSFRPVLSQLRDLSEKTFPFASEILVHSAEPQPSPFYLDFDILPQSTLDLSQARAMGAALTSRFTLIQGPPGCGKTFVGVKIVQAILNSKQKPPGPILVMTYKNHALDSFLEGCLRATQSLVRIGGGSSSDKIEKFNLNKVIEEFKSDFASEDFKKLLDARKQLQEIAAELEAALSVTMTELRHDDLLKFLHRHNNTQLRSLLEEHYAKISHQVSKQEFRGSANAAVDSILRDSQLQPFAVKVLKTALQMWLDPETIVSYLPNQTSDPLFLQENTAINEEQEELDEEDLQCTQKERVLTDNDSKLNFKEIRISKKQLYQQLMLRLPSIDIDKPNVRAVENVWSLTNTGRFILLTSWLSDYRTKKYENLLELLEKYRYFQKEVKYLENKRLVAILRSRDLVACTITGACLRMNLLSEMRPSIVIIEEAAEILESQLVAALPASTQHVVLIGDHRQLPPQVQHYRLARMYRLNVSIFERLANNGYPVHQLQCHRRGPASICKLFSHFYGQHLEVISRPSSLPACLTKLGEVAWWTHQIGPSSTPGGTSLQNTFEAQMIVYTVKFMTEVGGIDSNSITVITGYSGQFTKIKALMTEHEVKGVKVSTVDRFQGDENDYILLSMVRGQQTEGRNNLGFLSSPNRTCVALSRARKGLYIFGCPNKFESHDVWKPILEHIKKHHYFKDQLLFKAEGGKTMLTFEHPDDFRLFFNKLRLQKKELQTQLLNKFLKELPKSWIGKDDGIIDVTYVYRDRMETLMEESILNHRDLGRGRDADGMTFRSFHVLKVSHVRFRIHYTTYLHHREVVSKKKPPPLPFDLDTKAEWTSCELSKGCNEAYLFHGTKPDFWSIIAKDGFDERVANLSGMYGAGTYFAENADKSDHYATGSRRFMFLARVTLGNPYFTTQSGKWRRPPPIHQKDPGKLHDSIIARSRRKGGQNAASDRHQEFVIFDRYLCYPEFLIEYERR